MASPPIQPTGRSPLIFIFLTVFIDLLGFGIVIPLLPIYSKAYGASEAELGLLFGCFSGMQFLFAPMWGRVSDRIGRKPVLVWGLVGTAISYLVFGLSDQVAAALIRLWPSEPPALDRLTLGVLFVSRSLAGFFGANVSTASAFIADVTTPENRAKGMGLIGAAFGLGFTIGPAVGGELSQVSIEAPGIVAAALSLAAATFGWWMLKEVDRGPHKSTRLYGFDQVRGALRDQRIGGALAMGFLAVFAFSAFESMFILFGLAKFPTYFGMEQAVEHATRDQTFAAARYAGRYLFVVGMISALIQGGLIRRLVPRYGETRLAIAGPALLALGLAVVGGAPTFAWVIVGCVLLPCGFGLNNPSVGSLISRASPIDQQGAYLGLQQSLASLARMLGPALAGIVFDLWGPRSPFFSAAAALLLATLLAWVYHKRYAASFARASS
ncbi:MAG: MFS transporter [Planctomycetes bacterium]|nr:MFS transporter [Planctomycetota bacterium]